jgi:diguanylate cyclase (GGDEF)-like protein
MPPMTELRDRTIERRLTLGYVCALALVALLTIASHFILMGVLRAQDGSAAVINISGRQRMLSQRIASLAAQYEMGDGNVEGDLREAVDRFARQHDILVHGDVSLNIPAATMPALHEVYFEAPVRLDAQTHTYIAEARQILAGPPGDPAAQPVLAQIFAQATPLLGGLERVVAIHQRASERVLGRLQRIQDATLFIVLLTLLLEALGIFRPLVHRVTRYARQLTMLATLDGLTGLFNRRSFMERGADALSRCRRENGALGMLMIDADDFKRINDTYHHAGGDAVLRALAQVFRQEVRGGDCVGRLGGEEFGILLPKTGLAAAHQTAERLRGAVADMQVENEGRSIRVSVSIGIAALSPDDASLEMLMARADRALYRAKVNGRNRVEAAA